MLEALQQCGGRDPLALELAGFEPKSMHSIKQLLLTSTLVTRVQRAFTILHLVKLQEKRNASPYVILSVQVTTLNKGVTHVNQNTENFNY